jgi:hypothetical protein
MQVTAFSHPATWQNDLSSFDYSLFTIPEWIESFGVEDRIPVYFNFEKDGETVGKMAGLILHKDKPLKRKLFFHAGPSLKKGISEHNRLRCLQVLVSYARQHNMGRICMLSYDFKFEINTNKYYCVYPRSEYIIPLSASKDDVAGAISSEVKRRFKKAVAEGFSIQEVNTAEMIEELIGLIDTTKNVRLKKGYTAYNPFYIPHFNREVLMKLLINKALRIFVAFQNNQVFGIDAILVKDRKAYGLLMGFTENGYRFAMPSFINYYIIMKLKSEGFDYLNMGGVSVDITHQGLQQFKKSLGAVPCVSSVGETNYLSLPYRLLNPMLHAKRLLYEYSAKPAFQRLHPVRLWKQHMQ